MGLRRGINVSSCSRLAKKARFVDRGSVTSEGTAVLYPHRVPTNCQLLLKCLRRVGTDSGGIITHLGEALLTREGLLSAKQVEKEGCCLSFSFQHVRVSLPFAISHSDVARSPNVLFLGLDQLGHVSMQQAPIAQQKPAFASSRSPRKARTARSVREHPASAAWEAAEPQKNNEDELPTVAPTSHRARQQGGRDGKCGAHVEHEGTFFVPFQ